RYRPFYKWMHRGLPDLPILGNQTYVYTAHLVEPDVDERTKVRLIEEICTLVRAELAEQGLSYSESDFLVDHGEHSSSGYNAVSAGGYAQWRGAYLGSRSHQGAHGCVL
ncbi:MAG: hypothetical protein IJ976_06135, partial [Alistipes sp.]|nr:hypothetical protein [Alistipes sp.]